MITLSFYMAVKSQEQDYIDEVMEIERKSIKPGVIPRTESQILKMIKQQKESEERSYTQFVAQKERERKQQLKLNNKLKNKYTPPQPKHDDNFEDNDFDFMDDFFGNSENLLDSTEEDVPFPIYQSGKRIN